VSVPPKRPDKPLGQGSAGESLSEPESISVLEP
jgi:hypothetical protein